MLLSGTWPVAVELGILPSFAQNWEFLAKYWYLIFVGNKHDKVILIVFRTVTLAFLLSISLTFPFFLALNPSKYLCLTTYFLNVGIGNFGTKIGEKNMICHWEYSRILAIKKDRKKALVLAQHEVNYIFKWPSKHSGTFGLGLINM